MARMREAAAERMAVAMVRAYSVLGLKEDGLASDG